MISLLINQISSEFKEYEPFQRLREQLKKECFPVDLEGPQGGFLSILLANIMQGTGSCSLVVVPSEQEAENLVQDLSLLPDIKSALFPWWGLLPYGDGRPLPAIYGERAYLLSCLLAGEQMMIVAPLRSLLSPLPPPEHLKEQFLLLKRGDSLDLTILSTKLQALGYLRVPRVSLKGEYALRGEVVDIFCYGREEPSRLVLDFDVVAEIKGFNVVNQGSTVKLDELRIFPLREVIPSSQLISTLKKRLTSLNIPAEAAAGFSERFSLDADMQGAELYLPLCFEKNSSLLDYLPPGSNLIISDSEQLASSCASIQKEYVQLYRNALSKDRAVPPPKAIMMDFTKLTAGFQRKILLHTIKRGGAAKERLIIPCDPPRSFFGNLTYFREELENLLELGYRIYIYAVYEHQAERIKAVLKDLKVEVFPLSISSGFSLPQFKIMVIQENEIFGRKRRIPRSIGRVKSEAIDTFVELNPGDYVVHLNYGIGIFNGIERLKAAGNERDYIHLQYADGETIFIPIEQVNLIQRYIGQEGRGLRLDKIGGKGWESRKKRVKKSVEDLAQSLVKLHSRRRTASGFAFPADSDWQAEFEASFPYQETDDQLRCIEDVKRDMETPLPMDRLICGDVGYGKTEIALRAAFKAVMGGKQVAMLAPTTILVEQHFENFEERFRKFPVKVEMLSRFRKPKAQKKVIAELEKGAVDIIIGTHRMIQRDVHFKNLGLLVVDEEQRFGVKHKVRLKELKTSVDCLTLTATPIPRTLHMSLMKIRDMSTLNTPPQNRLPVETFIQEWDEEIIAGAIRNEISRGGQVYYLHNRVQSIPSVYGLLTTLLPEVVIDIAHGQMKEDELEDVMHRFISGNISVLLSTAIIENGLDIPNVNTIIIDRADSMGISQLYQLRGRVGRADRPAYAYLFYLKNRAISELAMKRLKIISDFTELGSGFKIALKDLEIRGAGNILGREQHGDILTVGYDLYIRLLDEAIAEINQEAGEEALEVYLELEYSGYIPDTYIAEPMEKMEVYKKISAISSRDELDRTHSELEDRFGPLPDEVSSIFAIAEIRIICKKLFVSSLQEKEGMATVEFSRLSHLSMEKVLRLIRESGGKVTLNAEKPNCLYIKSGKIDLKDKAEYLSERLSMLL